MTRTVIGAVRVSAGHDGSAELVVTLCYGNGGRSEVALDAPATAALLEACGSATADELIGHGWEKVQHALAVAWNRYSHPGDSTPCTT